MRLAPVLLFALAATSLHAAPRETRIPGAAVATATQLREQALADDTGWKVVESLTTEVGPRLAGSEADARAVEWAKAKFKQLGYDKVWTQEVTVSEMGTAQRARRGAGRARATVGADRARRQSRRYGRRRESCASRRSMR